ncbi:MAG: superoxide dismutase [Pseudomonadales bacterium]|nr:superoxide dismutase [Pseudomonadales bacterium]
MQFHLPDLPYALDALEPVISRRTMQHHYEKHHAGYVDKLNNALSGMAVEDMTLEELIVESFRKENTAVFNLAAQVWNHTFYWHSMTPDASPLEDSLLLSLIDESFGGLDPMLSKFKEIASGQFGSGWAWLLYDPKQGALSLTATGNAQNPLTEGLKPLLTIDVWEHAYYLDYQQDRAAYIDGVLDELVNWEYAVQNLSR